MQPEYTQFSIPDAIKFILDNIKDYKYHAYEWWTVDDIAQSIKSSISKNGFLFYHDGKEILGLVQATPNHEKKEVFVDNILTKKKGILKAFMICFLARFPGYNLVGDRNGIRVFYKTDKLARKIINLKG